MGLKLASGWVVAWQNDLGQWVNRTKACTFFASSLAGLVLHGARVYLHRSQALRATGGDSELKAVLPLARRLLGGQPVCLARRVRASLKDTRTT